MKLNRRQFLGAATISSAAMTQLVSQAADSDVQDRKLSVGLIGCGWYGMVDVEAALKAGGVEIVGLCDVDSDHLAKSAQRVEKLQGKRPKTFKLYQELLEAPGLQAVMIATPPHWHALQFLAALDKGLDIYCEKPLCYDLREGQAMVEAARRAGRVVQIGFQRRQSPAIQQVREHIQAGNAGRILQVEANIHYTAGLLDTTPQDPPASLDWDLWCGPAPKLPYCPQIGHFAWRLEQAYGHGHLVDWGIHLIDATRWILGESIPRSVQASGGLYQFRGKITTPDQMNVWFEFEKCPVVWRHRIWGAEEYTPEVANGLFFYGEKETVFVTDDRWVAIPKGKNAERKVTKASADMATAHVADFLKAVRGRTSPLCTVEDGFQSTATVKLAMAAFDARARLEWDAAAAQITGHPIAQKMMKRDYRQPWQHPYR
ncbi:MAG TPA: Gfo/Idh/MocA family oxidoreductase, partial [Candidatus Paceibacterota bacterium]|nr:Gfo/Idh/MocA family oxidoreductase [Candidatus Paceibacterota bacterium]